MVALNVQCSMLPCRAKPLTLGSAQTRLALPSLNRSLPWFLFLQFPRIATAATIAAASITASGGALAVVGHGVLVGFLLCSP